MQSCAQATGQRMFCFTWHFIVTVCYVASVGTCHTKYFQVQHCSVNQCYREWNLATAYICLFCPLIYTQIRERQRVGGEREGQTDRQRQRDFIFLQKKKKKKCSTKFKQQEVPRPPFKTSFTCAKIKRSRLYQPLTMPDVIPTPYHARCGTNPLPC